MKYKKLNAPKTENEIISHWKFKDKVYISCICIAYNQESYIYDAINSMLAQVTDYKFEILIHDDLSTDKTRDILLEYKKKYPSIIKLIFQEENQYSKGKKITLIAVSHAIGEYIALCEGDDFWISPYKINTQINHLNKNDNINLCVHNAYTLSMIDNVYINSFKYKINQDKIVPSKDIYKISGQFSPTASMFMRKKVFDNIPDLYYTAPVGDFFLEVIFGRDGIVYLSENMSVYRLNSVGSWTISDYSDLDKKINHNIRMLYSLSQLYYYLDEDNRRFVKYKKQFAFYNLTFLYFKKGNYKSAFKTWIKSLNGNVNLKFHLFIFLRIINYIR